MKYLPQLQWQPSRRLSAPLLVLLGASLMAGAALLYWQVRLEAQVTQRGLQLARVLELSARTMPDRKLAVPALSPAAEHQLSRQVALLNRDWTQLSESLAPSDDEVRLLGMDVDPVSGVVRITARADSTTEANMYAESLSKRIDTLRHVRLLGLERRVDGIRFEISAQWID